MRFRVAGSNERMPRSQSTTCAFPATSTYSAASSHSSTVAAMPRLSSTGTPDSPAARKSAKFCMLRAPICSMSAYPATALTSRGSSTSVTTARPCRSAAARSSSRPLMPSPWNAYGEVRGLKAPPRSTLAPARATAAATVSICSRDSTAHGPAQTASTSPPKPAPLRRRTTVRSERASRRASLIDCRALNGSTMLGILPCTG